MARIARMTPRAAAPADLGAVVAVPTIAFLRPAVAVGLIADRSLPNLSIAACR
jgi:hypothetical protein